MFCTLAKPNRKWYQTRTAPQNCIITPLSKKLKAKHRLPRVDSVAPNVGHAGINEVLPLYTKFVIDSVTYVLHPGKTKPEVVSVSLLSLKNLKVLEGRFRGTERRTAGINEVLPLYTKFVIDSVTYVLHPGKTKPEVVSNSHCTTKLYHHSSL